MARPNISEELVTLTQVIAASERLRQWFFDLDALPSAVRVLAFADMAAQMREAGEEPALISAIATLSRADVYAAVRQALLETRVR